MGAPDRDESRCPVCGGATGYEHRREDRSFHAYVPTRCPRKDVCFELLARAAGVSVAWWPRPDRPPGGD